MAPDESFLPRFEKLVNNERYRECLGEIDKIPRGKLDKENQLRIGVLESLCYYEIGNFKQAFETARVVVENGRNLRASKTMLIEGLLRMAEAASQLLQIDAIFEASEEAEQLRQELPKDDRSLRESIRASILYVESFGWYLRDDVYRGIDWAQESLSIRQQVKDLPGIVSSLMRLGHLQLEDDTNKGLEYLEKGLELNKDRQKKHIIQTLQHKGTIQVINGNWNEAEELLLQSISLAKEHDLGRWVPSGLIRLADLYMAKGEYLQAQEYYQTCLVLSEEAGAGLLISMSTNNLGEIHRAGGNLGEALLRYEECMRINKKANRMRGYVVALANCGMIHYARGDLKEAIQVLEESLSISKEKTWGTSFNPIEWGTLYTVLVLVEMGEIKRAQNHVEYLQRLVENSSREVLKQIYYLAASIVMKSSTLSKNRALAKKYLTEVVNGKLYDFEVSSMAHFLLYDLLIEDLRISDDRSLLDELKMHMTSFSETILSQGSTSLQVEILLLQSKISILEFEIDKANCFLNQARSFAEEKGLGRLLERIEDNHEVLNREISIWGRLGEKKPTLREQTEKTRIHEQISNMIQQGLWRKMLF
ncbi:MAG: tetratricopeptide repeat protein [Promethearchaeota archaeon]